MSKVQEIKAAFAAHNTREAVVKAERLFLDEQSQEQDILEVLALAEIKKAIAENNTIMMNAIARSFVIGRAELFDRSEAASEILEAVKTSSLVNRQISIALTIGKDPSVVPSLEQYLSKYNLSTAEELQNAAEARLPLFGGGPLLVNEDRVFPLDTGAGNDRGSLALAL